MLGILLGEILGPEDAMPKTDREKTNYPGVYFIMGKASNGRPEKIYYIMYRRDGRLIEEKVGRQYQNDMTPARAAAIRTKRIEGAASNQERREEAAAIKWTIDRLWQEYVHDKPATKGWTTDRYRYEKFLQSGWGQRNLKTLRSLTCIDCESPRQDSATPDREARPPAAGEDYQFGVWEGVVPRSEI